jgi:hypothetical protein
MAAVGGALLLLGFGALMVEVVPRRLRRRLVGVGSGRAQALPHGDVGPRALAKLAASRTRRLGYWVLGR